MDLYSETYSAKITVLPLNLLKDVSDFDFILLGNAFSPKLR